jgi:hypothetical protein
MRVCDARQRATRSASGLRRQVVRRPRCRLLERRVDGWEQANAEPSADSAMSSRKVRLMASGLGGEGDAFELGAVGSRRPGSVWRLLYSVFIHSDSASSSSCADLRRAIAPQVFVQ